MGFAQDLARFAQRTVTRLDVYADAVQAEAYKELERRLAEALPALTPQDTGALSRGYKFRVEDDVLVVENVEFYALAVRRFGGRYDLPETVLAEAEAIVGDRNFRTVVHQRALARARLG